MVLRSIGSFETFRESKMHNQSCCEVPIAGAVGGTRTDEHTRHALFSRLFSPGIAWFSFLLLRPPRFPQHEQHRPHRTDSRTSILMGEGEDGGEAPSAPSPETRAAKAIQNCWRSRVSKSIYRYFRCVLCCACNFFACRSRFFFFLCHCCNECSPSPPQGSLGVQYNSRVAEAPPLESS